MNLNLIEYVCKIDNGVKPEFPLGFTYKISDIPVYYSDEYGQPVKHISEYYVLVPEYDMLKSKDLNEIVNHASTLLDKIYAKILLNKETPFLDEERRISPVILVREEGNIFTLINVLVFIKV